MTWVKVCGMTNLEDALAAVEAGADAVGFVFYEKSPRCVSVVTAREIVARLPESVEKVGVFAGLSIEHALATSSYAGFGAVQVYPLTYKPGADGNWTAKASTSGLKAYVALPMAMFLGEGGRNVAGSVPREVDMLFLDSGNSQQPGGTGRTFDWHAGSSSVQELSLHQKVVIAGGLTPENVSEGIEVLKPFGVDVVSGVESSAGKKDPEKVRAFVRAVREADKKVS